MIEGRAAMFKRLYTGIGNWINYNEENIFYLLKENCKLDLENFPTNTPKKTDSALLEAIEKNLRYSAARICNLGMEDEVPALYEMLEDLKSPRTFPCNWDISKYIDNETDFGHFSESESEDTFENPSNLFESKSLSIGRLCVIHSSLPKEEPFFVGKIIAVNGRRPNREIRIQWLEHAGNQRTLFGNGTWELSG